MIRIVLFTALSLSLVSCESDIVDESGVDNVKRVISKDPVLPYEKVIPDAKIVNASPRSIEGVDLDIDGIRDDYELWVMTEFPTRPDLRYQAYKYARASQFILETTDYTLDIVKEWEQKSSWFIGCISKLESNLSKQGDIIEIVVAEFFDSAIRYKQKRTAFKLLHGEIMPTVDVTLEECMPPS